jgi:hypothetical protein
MACDIMDVHTAFESILGDKEAVYLAVPITSGKRLWNLALSLGCKDIRNVREQWPERFHVEVELPNVAASRAFALKVRESRTVVINPAIFLVKGWQQTDYMQLWKAVIQQYVNTIYLSHDWQYSSGCLEETDLAFSLGITVIDSAGAALTRRGCAKLVHEARHSGRDLDLTCLEDIFSRWQVYLS